jgi:hypothetical protein
MCGKKDDKDIKNNNDENNRYNQHSKKGNLINKKNTDISSEKNSYKKRVTKKEDGRYLIYYEF